MVGQDATCKETVLSVWEMTLMELQHNSKKSLDVLKLLSVLEGECIERSFIILLNEVSKYDLDNAMEELYSRHSLVTKKSKDGDVFYSINNLLKEVVLQLMIKNKEKQKFEALALKLIEAHVDSDEKMLSYPDYGKVWLPYVLPMFECFEIATLARFTGVARSVARALENRKELDSIYQIFDSLFRKVVQAEKKITESVTIIDHEFKILVLLYVIYCSMLTENFETICQIFNHLTNNKPPLKVAEINMNSIHSLVAAFAQNPRYNEDFCSRWNRLMLLIDTANSASWKCPQFADYSFRFLFCELDELCISTVKYLLALWYRNKRKYKKAVCLLSEILSIAGQHEEEKKFTIDVKFMLSLTLRSQCLFENSFALMLQAHQEEVKIANERSELALRMKFWLARLYYNLPQIPQALNTFQFVLYEATQALGPCHEFTISINYWTAKLFHRLNQLPKAVSMMTKVCQIEDDVYGPEHPYTINAKFKLSLMLKETSNLSEALTTLRKLKAVVGNHSDVMLITYEMASILRKQSEHEAAIDLLKDLHLQQCHLVPHGYDICTYMKSKYLLAKSFKDMHRWEESLALFLPVHTHLKNTLGSTHIQTVIVKYWIAYTYTKLGHFHEASLYLETVIQLYTKFFGSSHSYTIEAMTLFADVLHAQGRMYNSLLMLHDVYKISVTTYGRQHKRTLDIKFKIASVLKSGGKLDHALRVLSEACESHDACDDHACKYMIAMILKEQGKEEEALQVLKKTYTATVRVLSDGHDNVMKIKHEIDALTQASQQQTNLTCIII